MHRYFISYQCGVIDPTGCPGTGFGNWSTSRVQPITGPDDLRWIAEEIRVANPGNTTVVILGWQRYEES